MTETRTPAPSGAGKPAESKSGNRLLRFYRQVVAELRKVVWPTRKQLSTYFMVVLTFVVFVGYGIEAPEYKWDDFKGVDVKGKVADHDVALGDHRINELGHDAARFGVDDQVEEPGAVRAPVADEDRRRGDLIRAIGFY